MSWPLSPTDIYPLSLHDALPIFAVAQDDTDEWRASTMYGTYSWVLLHAGRHLDGEQLAVRAADTIRPDLTRSEEHTSELQSRGHLVCRLLLEKEKAETRLGRGRR